MLLPRGEAIGQTAEIVAVIQVVRVGFSRSRPVAIPGPELRGLRGADQSEIMFGVLKVVLGGDRVVACVSVTRQLKVFFRHMLRRAANSDVRAVQIIRKRQWVGLTTAMGLAAANSVILTK